MGAASADEDAPAAPDDIGKGASDDYDPWRPFNENMSIIIGASPQG